MSTITPVVQSLKLVATTGVGGFALQNATPAIATWTAPSDGQMHAVAVFGSVRVSSAETGGAITLQIVDPGGSAGSTQLDAGAHGTGYYVYTAKLVLVQSGSLVSVAQSSALTAGAAILWADIWGL